MDQLLQMLGMEGNPYFSAGFGLSIFGAGMAFLRKGSVHAMHAARKRYLLTLEVTSKDPSYPWLLQWLNKESRLRQSTMQQHVSVQTTSETQQNGELTTKFDFVPSPGTHMAFYNKRWMLVERIREKALVDFFETVKLTTLGRDPAYFEKLLEHARKHAIASIEGKTVIYTSWGTEWKPFGQPRRKRPLHSVILDADKRNKIVQDVKSFIQSSEWYVDRGIPYRRGYLLHGNPGSGKSSFIMALAGEIGYNICLVNLNERGLTDDRLAHSLNTIPPQSIVLLEDIDAAFTSRKMDDKFGTNVTFSGLLNTLDGVVAGEERIVFMTTNHIEALDPALVRPGRVDVMYELGDASANQIKSLFQKFYPSESDARADEFVQKLTDVPISMATLQGYFMFNKESCKGVFDHLDTLKQQHSKSRSVV